MKYGSDIDDPYALAALPQYRTDIETPHPPVAPQKYRTDIDGLRALAVLPVVAFHIYLAKFFPGGFVGVDIFFVISGYLISNNIYRSMSDGTFSIFEFYRNRIRRIFPALYAMYIACIIGTAIIGFPEESHLAGNSIISSIFFLSNIQFYGSGNYFDASSHTNPLLHTWSLSVEEQFYVLFPIALILIARLQNSAKVAILALLAIASLIASQVMLDANPTGVFYLVQYRAWELMVGGLLAIVQPPLPSRKLTTEVIGIGGIGLILGSVFLITENTPFPGVVALPTCLGAAALIYSGRNGDTLTARLLSLPALRFFGLISYSLYLWHWPIFVFAELANLTVPKWQKLVIVMTLSIALATLSWRYIERPFRQKTEVSTRSILAAGAALMIVMAGAATLTAPLNTLVHGPLPTSVKQALAYERYAADHPEVMREGTCFLMSQTDKFASFPKDKCLRLDSNRPNVLVLGDSHAAHLVEGLASQFPGINFLQASASGCRPVLNPTGETLCVQLMNYVFDDFLRNHSVDGVILSGRWRNDEVQPAARTAAAIAGAKAKWVVISGPIVEFSMTLPRLIAMASRAGVDADLYADRSIVAPKQREIDEAFKKVALQPNVRYFSIYDATTKSPCHHVLQDGAPRQFDYGHLTKEGSVCIARSLAPYLKF